MNRRGYSLLAALVILSLVAALGGGLFESLIRARHTAQRDLETRQARWLAESFAAGPMVGAKSEIDPKTVYRPTMPTGASLDAPSVRFEAAPSGNRVIVETQAGNVLWTEEISLSQPNHP